MEIVNNKALMFVTRKADQITALIPKSQVLDRQGDRAKMLVNWGLDESQILRNLRIKDVPHPILGRYKWPGLYTPFAHQRTTAAFLATHPRCYCFNEAGTGKSAAVAWAADYLMTKGRVSRVLIICPVSIMETAWRSDLFKTLMHRTVGIASGSRERRLRVIEEKPDFLIINFDGIRVVQDEIKAEAFDLIVIDEGSAVKNPSTDRWKTIASMVTASTRLWLLTGTPAAQSPVDAYGLAKLVTPQNVPRFAGAFRDQVMNKISQFKWSPKKDAQAIVFKALQPAIRFTKEECLDLPDMTYTTREVELTAQQKKYYELIRKQMMAVAAGAEITAVNAAVLMNKLLQVSAGAVYADDGDTIEFDSSNRFDELLSVIEQTEHKVLVFVTFKHSTAAIYDRLVKAGYTVDCINGDVSAGKRAEIIKRFQTEDDPRILLLQPQATAHGLTLTRADTVVWWSPTPSVELYLQANARVHRAGQTKKTTVVHLQGSPVERRMYTMLQGNVDNHQMIVDLYKQEIS